MSRLWFYVPDYPLVRDRLAASYDLHQVTEHSAEPGRVGGCPDDADVTVVGSLIQVELFNLWLRTSGISGLMIEGRAVPS